MILETGRLVEPALIAAAARAAVMAGADFLKTSTGQGAPGATLEAAAVLLAVIEEAEGRVGLKVSGGIRTTQQAAQYLYLADHLDEPRLDAPETLRFGASALLDDLERLLAVPPDATMTTRTTTRDAARLSRRARTRCAGRRSTYCTASAPSRMPSRRETTWVSVAPSRRSSGSISRKITTQSAITPSSTTTTDRLRGEIALVARHQQHHRGDRTRPGEQRDRQREHRDVVRVADRLELVGRARAPLGAPLEHHLERDQQQHHAARGAERRQADAEHAEQRLADEREAEQDQAREQRALERHPAPHRRRHAGRQRQQHRHQAERIDHHEQRGEGVQGDVEHVDPLAPAPGWRLSPLG